MLHHRIARENRSERHDIRDRLGIRAAADRFWRGLIAGGLPVHGKQCPDKRRGLRHIELRLVQRISTMEPGALKRTAHGRSAVLFRERHRVAVIQAHPDVIRGSLRDTEVEGEPAGNRILQRTAECLPARLHAWLLREKMDGFSRVSAKRKPVQITEEPPDRVLPLLRRRPVCRPPCRLHTDSPSDSGEFRPGSVLRQNLPHRDFLRLRQLQISWNLNQCLRVVRHHITSHASPERQESYLSPGAAERLLIDLVDNPLFPVDQRIFSIRREPGLRDLPAVRQIILHIRRACLLIAAKNQPHPAGERNACIANRLHGIKGGYDRPLVVDGAAPIHSAVPHNRVIRRMAPAIRLRDHIQMSEHRHHAVTLSHLRIAALPVHIVCGKAKLRRDPECLFKARRRSLTIRFARLRRSLDAPDAHQSLQRPTHCLL